jgi:hypothetical protein
MALAQQAGREAQEGKRHAPGVYRLKYVLAANGEEEAGSIAQAVADAQSWFLAAVKSEKASGFHKNFFPDQQVWRAEFSMKAQRLAEVIHGAVEPLESFPLIATGYREEKRLTKEQKEFFGEV